MRLGTDDLKPVWQADSEKSPGTSAARAGPIKYGPVTTVTTWPERLRGTDMAEVSTQPTQWPVPEEPFIEITHQDQWDPITCRKTVDQFANQRLVVDRLIGKQ